MKLHLEHRGQYLVIQAMGRLDAAWAEHFTDTLLAEIRKGRHYLVLDASEMPFLSSAGIRALLMVHKELSRVSGQFAIIRPTAFVEQTLRTSGFHAWLDATLGENLPAADEAPGRGPEIHGGIKYHALNRTAELTAAKPAGWRPWQAVETSHVLSLVLETDTCAFGIGSAAASSDDARDQFGEFLAVAGSVVYQPPDAQAPPDYLISEKQFVPQMQCIQTLTCQGSTLQLRLDKLGHLLVVTSQLRRNVLSLLDRSGSACLACTTTGCGAATAS